VLLELTPNYLYVSDIPEKDAPSIILLLDTFGFRFNENLNGWAIGANDTPNVIDDVLVSFEESNAECIIGENLQHFINNQLQKRENFVSAREQARKYKNGELDEIISPAFNEHLASFSRPLRNHQIKAAQHLYLLNNGANFSVPGAGKTSVVLSVYEMLKNEGDVNCLFVVGPTACFHPWINEFKKQLSRTPKNVILAGMIKQERVINYFLPVNRRPELYLISYQTLTNDLHDIREFFKNKDNNIYFVVDEAHYIKQLGGAWAQSVLSIAPYANKKCILTGTPLPHGYPDLYNMFDVLWNETTPIDNTNRIRVDYLMKTNNTEEAKNIIDEAIGPLFYRVRKSELGLGPQIFHPPIMIEMKEKERFLYDSIAESIRQFSREDYLLEADTLVNLCRARIMRLRQAASYPKLLDTAMPNYNENLWQTDSEIANTIYNYDDLEKPAKLDKLIELVKDFKDKNLKWVKSGQIHLTLKFIGYTPPDLVEKINEILSEVVKRHEWIELLVKGTGCFPVPSRPRVLWLGITGKINRLNNFVSDINVSLEKLGFPIEEKEFIPHITIGRVSYPPKSTPDISTFLQTKYNSIPMSITRVRLICSELFPNGPIYSILGTHFLTTKGSKE